MKKQSFLFVHRWLGLISGVVVFIVAITGCCYVFEEEARAVFQHKYLYVQPQGAKQELTTVSDAVKKAFPKETITQIRFKTAADAAYIYYTKSNKAISVNPYDLSIIGIRNTKTDFFNWIQEMHTDLHLGKIGNEIVRWNVLIFFILCVSGLILWWPKQKRFLKQAVRINFGTKNWKRLNWDLHSVLGFYALLVLLIISLTGMFWMFDWVKQTAAFVTGSKITNTKAPLNKAKSGAVTMSMEQAYAMSLPHSVNAAQVFISNPSKAEDPIRVLYRYPYTIVRKQSTFYFDKYSGEQLRADLHENYSNYDKVLRSNYDFHTGRIRILGIGSKIVYFLASLIAATLPITGCIMWWSRGRKTRKVIAPGRYTLPQRPSKKARVTVQA